VIQKYTLVILWIMLIGGIVVISDEVGFSKSSSSKASHRHYVSKEIPRTTRMPVLRSSCVLVEDQQTSEFLVQKNATNVVPIASLTKLMTAMVVLDFQMDLQKTLIIEREDVDMLRHSRSHLPVGTHLTGHEALLVALMSSENRAAHALSRMYPGGKNAFVAAMNAKAQFLGLVNTHFIDPAGLSSGNVSSAHDLAKMANAAYQYPLIRELTTCEEAMIQSGRRKLAFKNTNQLLRSSRWQIGLSKTGFIDESGRCLVMQANVAQRPVLIVLLDAPGSQTRLGDANRIKQWIERMSSAELTRRG
jgi:serine-type D-Ala-D-Ala endopeptidase (penicillin-binding protein 7)